MKMKMTAAWRDFMFRERAIKSQNFGQASNSLRKRWLAARIVVAHANATLATSRNARRTSAAAEVSAVFQAAP
jgi:hypothetical protein